MLKIIFIFAVLNALGLMAVICSDKRNDVTLPNPAMILVIYIVTVVFDVLVVRYIL